MKDKDLYGHDLKIKKLPSPEECQRWCQETKDCEMFVYATKTFGRDAQKNDCYLKKKMPKELTELKGTIAGPKFCPISDEGLFCFRKVKDIHFRIFMYLFK